MEYGCRVCNGLDKIEQNCPNCRQLMKDLGRMEDYYSAYSPYEEQDKIASLKESDNYCIHLLKCEKCGRISKIFIPFEVI